MHYPDIWQVWAKEIFYDMIFSSPEMTLASLFHNNYGSKQ